MSYSSGAHDDPNPRAEIAALLEAADLGRPVDHRELDALVKIQENLRINQEQLARWLLVKKITKLEYVTKLDTLMRETARAGEEVLGFDDFHRVFGEFSVKSILDVKAFVGAGDGFLAR